MYVTIMIIVNAVLAVLSAIGIISLFVLWLIGVRRWSTP